MANLPDKPRGGKPLSKQALYSKVSSYGGEIIDFLIEQMRNEHIQDSVRQSAANKLIDKILPNLKSTDLLDNDGQSVIQRIIIETSGQANKTQ